MLAFALLIAQVVLSPCSIEGVPGSARCGTYRVYENRETKQGRQIDLSIIVLEALSSSRQPDPLFMLQGGPGDAPSFNARFYSRVFAQIRQTRDFVLVDLRGTGKSNPLTCPELAKPDASGVLDENVLSVSALRECRARLEQQADLRFYTTEIAVDDLDEVRQALGYQKINLYGTSYGTRVAQVYMRRHPSALRTVTMKGIVPPSLASPSTHARSGEEAWRKLVQRCEKDSECHRNFPRLDADLRELIERLEKTAPVVTAPATNSRPAVSLKVTGKLFAEAFRSLLYSPETAARAPALVKSLLSGSPGMAGMDQRALAEAVLSTRLLFATERLAAGFFLSVSCTEDIPFLPRRTAPLVAGTFGGDYRLRQQLDACKLWPRGRVSAQHRRATRSSIPTLILSGEFDPVTPPSGGEEVVRGLRNGRHVVVSNNGHPIGSADECISAMIGSLIDSASVKSIDAGCASKLPRIPFQAPTVTK